MTGFVEPDRNQRFPDEVIVALHNAGVTVTILPVQIGSDEWQAALFYVLPPGAACLQGGRSLQGPFTLALDAELHEHANGSLIELGVELSTPVEPVTGTVMFLTGHSSTHFEVLTLLGQQADLPLFIGDEFCKILWQQRVPLSEAIRSGLRSLVDDSVARDAVIRMTDRYDPDKVFTDVLAGR